jgi:hypothetical protein
MSDKKSAKKKAEVINKKPLIANPTRANQRVSDTEMPEPLKKREMRISSGNETLLKSWIKSKHDQMISFNPIPAYAIENPAQRPYFRGSSLPVCPLRTALDTVRKVPRNETRHLLMDFYTGTGHVIHELLQFWFGVDGSLFGKFQCPECAQLFPKKSTPHDNIGMFGPHVCKGPKSKPHRPTVCKYIEFHINNIPKTGAFDGHCDGVLFVNGKYLVLEIKTTDTAKVRAREKYGPDPKHRVQATAYRYLLPPPQAGRARGDAGGAGEPAGARGRAPGRVRRERAQAASSHARAPAHDGRDGREGASLRARHRRDDRRRPIQRGELRCTR